jgi:hypothetical protein
MNKFNKSIQKVTEATTQPSPTPYNKSEIVTTNDAARFSSAQEASMSKRGTDKDQVDILSEEGAQTILNNGGKLYLSQDGTAGAFLKADGYMGGLFKDPTANRNGAAKILQDIRRKDGGYFFDAYATHLEDIYIKNGFRPVARLDFVEGYAPVGWDSEGSVLASKPDVAFFVYDSSVVGVKGDGERMEDWDEAYELAKNTGR